MQMLTTEIPRDLVLPIVRVMQVLGFRSSLLFNRNQTWSGRSRRRVDVCRQASSGQESTDGKNTESSAFESIALPENVCLIEGRHSVKDFANLQKEELKVQVESRRSKIFLLLEEIRRLRLQIHLKSSEEKDEEEFLPDLEYSSVVPMFNKSHFLQEKNMKKYIGIYLWAVLGVILFGGLIAPSLEVKMGLGGTSYLEFIQSLHLPEQLAEVDPIVASFCGGAVGALSTLLVVDLQNVRNQQRNRCYYCKGVGYLPCGSCVGSGIENSMTCGTCSGTGKVMCPNCFCTGKHLVTEHDPRFDPFD